MSPFQNNKLIQKFNEFENFTGVVTIVNSAFRECSALVEIAVPENVINLGSSFCYNATSLKKVVFAGDKISYIPFAAFYQCTKMNVFEIPSKVTSISEAAIQCESLTRLTLPATLISVGNGAFRNPNYIQSWTILCKLQTIGQSAFKTAVFSSIDLSEIKTIGYGAFERSSLTSADIGEKCSSIASAAFFGCSTMEQVIIRAATPPALGNINAFGGASSYPIYVPSAYLADYQSTSPWSSLGSRLQAIP